jgi:hypothetical protein
MAILLTQTGSGTWVKPQGITKLVVECWGGGGNAEGTLGSVGSGGGAGGQYARSIISYPETELSIPYVISQRASATSWDTNVVIAQGGASSTGGSGAAGSDVGGVGDIVYKGGNGGNQSGAPFGTNDGGGGGGGAGSTNSGSSATSLAEGGPTAEYGGAGGRGGIYNQTNPTLNPGQPGQIYGGGGGGGSRFGINGLGAQGLIRITFAAGPVPKLEWNGNTLDLGFDLDNAVSYSSTIDGSQFVRTENGTEYSWIPNTNYILEGDVRWIPSTSTATQTGWDGGTGWRAFLEYARAKNKFNFFAPSDYLTPIESYLVEPLNGEHTLEIDGTRRFRLVIRNSTTPYEGF